jgi:hypothetical protein
VEVKLGNAVIPFFRAAASDTEFTEGNWYPLVGLTDGGKPEVLNECKDYFNQPIIEQIAEKLKDINTDNLPVVEVEEFTPNNSIATDNLDDINSIIEKAFEDAKGAEPETDTTPSVPQDCVISPLHDDTVIPTNDEIIPE